MNDPSLAKPQSIPAVLELQGVSVPALERPERAVLEEVHWRVEPGEFWFVCGLHRSGKSDLLAVAAGILPPLHGVCRLFGQEVCRGAQTGLAGERLRVGLVFDGGRMLHDLTLAENVALPMAYHLNLDWETALRKVQPVLEWTGLSQRGATYPAGASRIWQKRADLARALALEPELLLVDNPLAGLDPQDTRWWLQILSQLAAGHPRLGGRPMTVVVTGNSLAFWAERAHRFAVLMNRRMVILKDRPGRQSSERPLLEPLLPSDLGLG